MGLLQKLAGTPARPRQTAAPTAAPRRKVGRPTKEQAAERARAESARLDAEIRLVAKRREFEQLKATGRTLPVSVTEARRVLEESGFGIIPAGGTGEEDVTPLLRFALNSRAGVAFAEAAGAIVGPMLAPLLANGAGNGMAFGPPVATAYPTVLPSPPTVAVAPSPPVAPTTNERLPAVPADVAQRLAAMQPAALIGDTIIAGVAGKTASEAAAWLLTEAAQAGSTGDLVRELLPKLTATHPALLPHLMGVVAKLPGWESLAGYVGTRPDLLASTVAEVRRLQAEQAANTPSL